LRKKTRSKVRSDLHTVANLQTYRENKEVRETTQHLNDLYANKLLSDLNTNWQGYKNVMLGSAVVIILTLGLQLLLTTALLWRVW